MARWGNAGVIGETRGGSGEAGPSAAGDLGEARCEGGRAGPAGAVGVGDDHWSGDGGEVSGGVDGGEPVLPGVFPVMLHDPGDPPLPTPSLPFCGQKH